MKIFKRLSPNPGAVTAEPSEARLRNWMLIGLFVLTPPILFGLYITLMFPGLTNADALDFAQLGRNLLEGRGFSTYILRPLAIASRTDALHMPDVTHGPLFPLFLAIAFGVLGAKDNVAAFVSGAFYLLTIPVIYLLGVRLFSRPVAIVATLVYAFNALMLEYAASGLHITQYIFITSLLLLVTHGIFVRAKVGLHDVNAPLPKGRLAFAGILTGALYLTDPMFFCVAPIMFGMMFWLHGARRLSASLWFLIPLLILIGPWMVRNGLLTGNAVYGLRGSEVWMQTKGHYPGLNAYRQLPSEIKPGPALVQSVVQKILLGAGQVIRAFPQITVSWVLAFLLPSLLFRFSDEAANRVRRLMMYCFFGIFATTVALGIQMPLFVSLIPTMLVFAVAYLLYLLQQAQLSGASRAFTSGLIGVAIVFPLISDMTLREKPTRIPDAGRARELHLISGSSDISISDQPWIAAWYADRPSIWVPASDTTIVALRKQFKGVRWLFLTQQARGLSPDWRNVYDTFQSWNMYYSRAKESGAPEPTNIKIRPQGGSGSLLTALSGFMSVPPGEDWAPTTVLAGLEAEQGSPTPGTRRAENRPTRSASRN